MLYKPYWIEFWCGLQHRHSLSPALLFGSESLQIFEVGIHNATYTWPYSEMPEELAALCQAVFTGDSSGPWRQVVDWLLQNEDLTPPGFWKLLVRTVNNDIKYSMAGFKPA
jgi:hypothetical protein